MTYGRSVRVGAAVAAMVGTIVVIDACTGDDPAVVAPSAVDGGEASVDGGAPLDAADVEPIDAGPLRISALAAGFDVACAIVESKGLSLWCWGSNASRMLDPAGGGGSTCRYGGQDYDCSPTPKMIDPGPISSVALGQSFGCVVKQGVAYCWGDNSAQEVGSSQVSTVACDTLWPFAERNASPPSPGSRSRRTPGAWSRSRPRRRATTPAPSRPRRSSGAGASTGMER